MHADSHVFDVDTARADMLTASEIDGRRKARAMMDVIRKYAPSHSRIGLVDLAAKIGVRETHRIRGSYTITEKDILAGGTSTTRSVMAPIL